MTYQDLPSPPDPRQYPGVARWFGQIKALERLIPQMPPARPRLLHQALVDWPAKEAWRSISDVLPHGELVSASGTVDNESVFYGDMARKGPTHDLCFGELICRDDLYLAQHSILQHPAREMVTNDPIPAHDDQHR